MHLPAQTSWFPKMLWRGSAHFFLPLPTLQLWCTVTPQRLQPLTSPHAFCTTCSIDGYLKCRCHIELSCLADTKNYCRSPFHNCCWQWSTPVTAGEHHLGQRMRPAALTCNTRGALHPCHGQDAMQRRPSTHQSTCYSHLCSHTICSRGFHKSSLSPPWIWDWFHNAINPVSQLLLLS